MAAKPTSAAIPQRTVRLAWAADVDAIGAIQVTALRETLPPELAADLDAGLLAEAWRRAVTTPPSARHRVLVATEGGPGPDVLDAVSHPDGHLVSHPDGHPVIAAADLGTSGRGRVVGFAATAPAEDPDAVDGADGEVLALHTLHTAREDDDLTAALLAAAADTLEADGFSRGQLWVGATQDGLRRVAEGAGWSPDGAHRRLELPAATSGGLAQVRLHTGLTEQDTVGSGGQDHGPVDPGADDPGADDRPGGATG